MDWLTSRLRFLIAGSLALSPLIASAEIPLYQWEGDISHSNATSPFPSFGRSVDFVQDVNGDGSVDILIGAPAEGSWQAGAPGKVSVRSGRDGSLLYSIVGESVGEFFGASVTNAGDVDGDGRGDFVVGAPRFNEYRGIARLYSGATGTKLCEITGDRTQMQFGHAVSGGADVNGDGRPDFVVGGPFYAPTPAIINAGLVAVIGYNGTSCTPLWTAAGQANDQVGYAVLMTGQDINLDRRPDLVVGAPGNAGQVVAFTSGPFVEIGRFVGSGALRGIGESIAFGPGTLAAAAPLSNTVAILGPASGGTSYTLLGTVPGSVVASSQSNYVTGSPFENNGSGIVRRISLAYQGSTPIYTATPIMSGDGPNVGLGAALATANFQNGGISGNPRLSGVLFPILVGAPTYGAAPGIRGRTSLVFGGGLIDGGCSNPPASSGASLRELGLEGPVLDPQTVGPYPGSRIVIEIRGRANTAGMLLYSGTADTSVGVPGTSCTIRVDPRRLFPVPFMTDASGLAVVRFPIPRDNRLLGTKLVFQAFLPGNGPAGFEATNAQYDEIRLFTGFCGQGPFVPRCP